MWHDDLPPAAPGADRQRVLLIDDAPDVHALVRVWLMEEAVDLAGCFDGDAGVAAARAAPPDLILLDVDMPGTDGFAVCRALKADPATAAVPVIFLTGASSSQEKLQGLELGATDYVTKPFEPAELRARVRAALRTKQLMDLLAHKAQVLQESEERFRFLAEDSSDLISRHDAAGRYLYASPAALALLGEPGPRMTGRSFLDLIHPDDRPVFVGGVGATGLAPVLREVPATAVRMRHADGAYRWLEVTIRAAQGGAAFHASARDVGRRKRLEELEQERTRVLEMLAVGRPLEEVLGQVTGMIERHQPEVSACVMVLHEGEVRVVGPSLPPDFLAAVRARALRLAVAACGDAATAGRTDAAVDVLSDPAWLTLRDVAARHDIRVFAVRLIQGAAHGVIGLVGGFARAGREPGRDLQNMLDVAAGLCATVAEHRQLQERLTYQARHDPLTGLPNRTLFDERLRDALAAARAPDPPADGEDGGPARRRRGHAGQVGLMLFDIDRFKLVNDTLGHPAGDQLLRQFARRVQGAVRQSDTLARLGGDEFALILPSLTGRDEAATVAGAIREALRPAFDVAFRSLVVTSSIGIALYPADAADAAALQGRADVALYRVKVDGRDGYRCFEPGMDASASRRVTLEARLRAAVGADPGRAFRLYYQPQIGADGRTTGVEALLRWHDADLGEVAPADFIPVAEETGLIVPLGAWALGEACRQGRAWRDAGLPPLWVAVNVSPLQCAQPDFVETVLATAAAAGFDPARLELEITESCVMRNVDDTAAKLRRLAAAGVRVAIDDFGTGHSSLAYLDKLPVHRLKIDRAFVRPLGPDVVADRARTVVVRAIVSLGRSLGIGVVAEGVETAAQRDFLREIGCEDLQGYLFSTPRPAPDLLPFLSGPAAHPPHSAAASPDAGVVPRFCAPTGLCA